MLENEIGKLLRTEKVMWKQQAKTEWLEASDKNTTFFSITKLAIERSITGEIGFKMMRQYRLMIRKELRR